MGRERSGWDGCICFLSRGCSECLREVYKGTLSHVSDDGDNIVIVEKDDIRGKW